MRISTSTIYDTGVAGMQTHQQAQLSLQQHVSSGLRVLTAGDDPVAAAAILNIKQAQALNSQYDANGGTATNSLSLEESALSDLTTLLQNVKTQAVYAGSGGLNNGDRATLAMQLQQTYQDLIGIANRTDGTGQYLFAGYRSATTPFTENGPGNVAYNGDAGQRQVQIDENTLVAINDTGDAVFRGIRSGNGLFVAAAGAANTGSGVIGTGTVTGPAQWNAAGNGKDFSIRFHVDNSSTPPATTYDIVDNVNNRSLLTGAAPGAGPYLRSYTAGTSITLATQSPPDTNATPFDYGAAVSIDGAPASGDRFSVKASARQDIFATVQSLISTLQSGPSGTAASSAAYQNALNGAMNGIDNALNNVLNTRAAVGSRLQQISTAQASAQEVALQYKQTASTLQDLDYTKAISDLNQQQVFLQAAQQSFLKVTSLNLFSML